MPVIIKTTFKGGGNKNNNSNGTHTCPMCHGTGLRPNTDFKKKKK